MSVAEAAQEARRLRESYRATREEHGPGWRAAEAFEAMVRHGHAVGMQVDALDCFIDDEHDRFMAKVIPGPGGHYYWDGGKHFRRNDGRYRLPVRWWWAQIYGEELSPYQDLAIRCGEPGCINPRHFVQDRAEPRRQFSREEMLDTVRRAAEQLGRIPRSTEWDKLGFRPTRATYRKQIGLWSEIIRAAGLEYTHAMPTTTFKPMNAQQCIDGLRFARDLLGDWPTGYAYERLTEQLRAAGLPTSITTIKLYLGGSWAAAIETAKAAQ